LWVVRLTLRGQIPTLAQYASEHGISPDTIRRAGRALLRPVLACLRERRPGPRTKPSALAEAHTQAGLACNDILKSLLPAPLPELLSSPAKRGSVAQAARHWVQRGVPLATLADWLSLSTKTLHRWIARLADHQVQHQSRRPKTSPRQLPLEIQRALWKLRRAMPGVSIAELTRVFVRKFGELLHQHGRTSLSAKSVGRYVALPDTPKDTTYSAQLSRRGDYRYPPPLAMAWIDTTYFAVAGTTVHVVAAMEASSRVALAGEVFVQESAATTVDVLGRALARVPELSAVLRDRGTPYLNTEVNEMLGARDVVPIDAHPYFPIDKAALERFWRWLKEWLRYALALFEDECRRERRTPDAAEVVGQVQPVLRTCLRAYNLLPQPYLEDNSPIERMDRLLRADGDPGFSLSDLRRLAIERETKDDLLVQARDGLQLDRKSLATMRADFATISRTALLHTLNAVGHKLFVARGPAISRPYGYLLAVAKVKEREHQKNHAHETRSRADERERQAHHAAIEQSLQREAHQVERQPEAALPAVLDAWVKAMAGRIHATRHIFARRLGEILDSLRRKLGAAFTAQLDAVRASLPALAARARPGDAHLAERLLQAFPALVPATACAADAAHPLPTRPAIRWSGNQVRGSPPDPPDAHVSGTDVSP
jgi:hypothetical protein